MVTPKKEPTSPGKRFLASLSPDLQRKVNKKKENLNVKGRKSDFIESFDRRNQMVKLPSIKIQSKNTNALYDSVQDNDLHEII